MIDYDKLWADVQAKNGKRRTRIMDRGWFDFAISEFEKRQSDETVKRVRVYPGPNAFVANAYAKKGRAVVTAVQFDRTAEGWSAQAILPSATRSRGGGSYVTVNGHGI